eukprot:7067755-Alexandrium_andersonii.AAC.1
MTPVVPSAGSGGVGGGGLFGSAEDASYGGPRWASVGLFGQQIEVALMGAFCAFAVDRCARNINGERLSSVAPAAVGEAGPCG